METVRLWMSSLGSDPGSVALEALKNSVVEEEGDEKWRLDIVKHHRQRTEAEENHAEMQKANAVIDELDQYFEPTVKFGLLDELGDE